MKKGVLIVLFVFVLSKTYAQSPGGVGGVNGLPLPPLPKGIYILRVMSNTAASSSKLVIR